MSVALRGSEAEEDYDLDRVAAIEDFLYLGCCGVVCLSPYG